MTIYDWVVWWKGVHPESKITTFTSDQFLLIHADVNNQRFLWDESVQGPAPRIAPADRRIDDAAVNLLPANVVSVFPIGPSVDAGGAIVQPPTPIPGGSTRPFQDRLPPGGLGDILLPRSPPDARRPAPVFLPGTGPAVPGPSQTAPASPIEAPSLLKNILVFTLLTAPAWGAFVYSKYIED